MIFQKSARFISRRSMASIILSAGLLLGAGTAMAASDTWIVIGDSIMSGASQGTAKQFSLNLVSNERNVIFKNMASPGAALGATDFTGFNSQSVIENIGRTGGFFSAYKGVLIQAGTNDFGRSIPLADVSQSVRRIAGAARITKKKVLVLEPIWRSNENVKNKLGLTLNSYRETIRKVCQVEFKDVCYFASRTSTIMGTVNGKSHYDAGEVAKGNQLHPNVKGNRYLADWIKLEARKANYF